jgi:hypothetical protein
MPNLIAEVPDLDICHYCKRPIRPEQDAVWEPPAAAPAEEGFGAPLVPKRAHADCYDKVVAAIEQTD